MTLNQEYNDWMKMLQQRLRSAKNKVALTVNTQLIELYWYIGKELTEKANTAKWGEGIMGVTCTLQT